jgi:Asp-tRNA(Asn)/Glu-tRNA(Gln) amidotransferase A subunit family amidase
MIDLSALNTIQAAAAIGRGDITSEALVSACLARIAAREAEVQAFVHLDPEYAIAQARAADKHQKSGLSTGPLHGVPVGIKDIIDTADMPTQCGSPAFKDNRPEEDAACVAALRAAGAIIIGKTVTTELATLTPNKTHNPRNLAHTPGGSSSGSAAAVADNMIPAALGTQTGGSVIRPASFCGIYGYKPTFGMIPRTGVLDQSKSLDTVGIYGRSVEDLALLGDVLCQPDSRDAASVGISRGSLLATCTEDWTLPPMFAFIKTSAWAEHADAVTKEAFGELVETLKGQVEELSLDATTERGLAAAKTIQNAELAVQFGPILDHNPELISKRLAAQIEEGRSLSAADYVRAQNYREIAYRACIEMFVNYGNILTPAATGPAPKGLETTGNPIFNAFWTYTGSPCVTLPLLEADGLPIGVQIVGARRHDGRLLRSARLLERMLAEPAA